jgi:hypothetical protein
MRVCSPGQRSRLASGRDFHLNPNVVSSGRLSRRTTTSIVMDFTIHKSSSNLQSFSIAPILKYCLTSVVSDIY